jgi:hypothetical protein
MKKYVITILIYATMTFLTAPALTAESMVFVVTLLSLPACVMIAATKRGWMR